MFLEVEVLREGKPVLEETKFVVLARDEALATLDTSFDAESSVLGITAADVSERFAINTDAGREAAAKFVAAYLGLPEDQTPTLYSADPHKFTDVSVTSPEMMNAVSLINLDSVQDFAEQIGQPVDPARFRGNLYFSGLSAYSELDLIGETVTVGDVELKIVQRTKRCPATQVNPTTGVRDIDVPRLLRDNLGHPDMGVYGIVKRGGKIAVGDVLTAP